MKTINLLTLCLCLFSVALQAKLLKPLPKESGFDGFILTGVNYTNFASNIVAGNSLTNISHDSTNDLSEGPSHESDISPVLTGELNYMFAPTGTQLYLGNELEDVIKYDLSTQLGIRQSLSHAGVVKAAFLTSGRLPTYVYSDPFNIDNADKTDRNTKGVRLGWDNIFDHGINVELTRKKIEVEDEYSGELLSKQSQMTEDDLQLLSRDGTASSIKLSYLWFARRNHIFEPELVYDYVEKEGDALSHDRYGAGLSYLYTLNNFMFVSQVVYTYSKYDEVNPVWDLGEVGDATNFGASIVGSYANPFGLEGMSIMGSIAYGSAQSNIDFYDSEVLTMFVGILFKI